MKIFNNIRVLELGRVYSGPLCGMVLSDLGCEVIKIERPGSGDESRKFGKVIDDGETSYFNSLNRNKKSIDLNLSDTEDRKIFIELIKTSDVIVHNWIQNSLDKLGFSYDEVKKINPRIIYCSISGYGYKSEFRNTPSQDIIAQAISGLMSLTGEENRLPLKTGIPIVDYATGLYAAFAIMSALLMRERVGVGQLVHTSLLETALAITSFEAQAYLSSGILPKRNGNRHPSICPYNVYETKDGYVTLAVANQDMWLRFCDALDLKELKESKIFSSNQLRLENQDNLETVLKDILKEYQSAELVKILSSNKVSCAKINNIEEAFVAPEITALNMTISPFDKPDLTLINKPYHLEALSDVKISAPPKLGQDKADIVKELLNKSKS